MHTKAVPATQRQPVPADICGQWPQPRPGHVAALARLQPQCPWPRCLGCSCRPSHGCLRKDFYFSVSIQCVFRFLTPALAGKDAACFCNIVSCCTVDHALVPASVGRNHVFPSGDGSLLYKADGLRGNLMLRIAGVGVRGLVAPTISDDDRNLGGECCCLCGTARCARQGKFRSSVVVTGSSQARHGVSCNGKFGSSRWSTWHLGIGSCVGVSVT